MKEEKKPSGREENLQHIEEMLQFLTDEQLLFVEGFLGEYYF